MDRSSLFILAVTPNIVALNAAGEENYVVRREYPEALERGKKVIAAELDRTDRGALLLKFDDLPECINAWDELVLDESLSFLDAPDNCEDDAGDLSAEPISIRSCFLWRISTGTFPWHATNWVMCIC